MKFETVIVETPKGQGLKYDYDPASGYMKLTKVMPAGMVFPFDFGYIPATRGEDGDPLDVIVISELGTFPGCAMECRIIGAINAIQTERDGQELRNDRYIAVPNVSVLYQDINTISDFQPDIIKQIDHFFSNYNREAGKRFHSLRFMQAREAYSLIEEAKLRCVSACTKLVQILIPLYDPEGRPFNEDLYLRIRKELTERFGGVTIYARSPAVGLWKDDQEKTVADNILIFEVMETGVESAFWKSYKCELQDRFKQEELVIRSSDIHVF